MPERCPVVPGGEEVGLQGAGPYVGVGELHDLFAKRSGAGEPVCGLRLRGYAPWQRSARLVRAVMAAISPLQLARALDHCPGSGRSTAAP